MTDQYPPHIRPCNCHKHRDDLTHPYPVAQVERFTPGQLANGHVVDWLCQHKASLCYVCHPDVTLPVPF